MKYWYIVLFIKNISAHRGLSRSGHNKWPSAAKPIKFSIIDSWRTWSCQLAIHSNRAPNAGVKILPVGVSFYGIDFFSVFLETFSHCNIQHWYLADVTLTKLRLHMPIVNCDSIDFSDNFAKAGMSATQTLIKGVSIIPKPMDIVGGTTMAFGIQTLWKTFS